MNENNDFYIEEELEFYEGKIDLINYEVTNAVHDYEALQRQYIEMKEQKALEALEQRKIKQANEMKNTKAVIALSLGILSLVCAFSLGWIIFVAFWVLLFTFLGAAISIVLGIMALKEEKKNYMAIAGIVCSIFAIIFDCVYFLFDIIYILLRFS